MSTDIEQKTQEIENTESTEVVESISATEEIKETTEMLERDRKDSTRKHSPLKKTEDAVEIDTTGISIEEQVNRIVEIVNKTIK
jgi:cytidylate kinase